MSPEERNERMVAMVKEHLDARADALDDRTAARLRAIRLQAVESAEGKRGWFRFLRWIAVGGLATAAVAVLAVSLWMTGPRRENTVATADDIEIVAAQEQMQFYEDIEFYRWLAAQENGG
ncbi:DUF3619 family protein [Geobacter grbiciae]|uniref:DUF3619 family protein n=1 Tax=Geobacter grbiciae TaxID=155042 RepID=UPI001C0135AB|nr:DUF3619 family protein [Geobacter grbiciae]MBT1075676.1 hypothetical protein [Geobacter grbiciae]